MKTTLKLLLVFGLMVAPVATPTFIESGGGGAYAQRRLPHYREGVPLDSIQLSDPFILADSATRELQKAQYELEVAKEQQRQANDRVLTLEGRKNHFDILLESLAAQSESLRLQRENLQKRTSADAGRMETLRGTIAGHEAQAEKLRGEMEKLQQEQADCRQAVTELTDALTQTKTRQAALSAEGESARRSMEDLARLRESLEGEHTDRETLRRQMQQAMEQAQAEEQRQLQQAQTLRSGIEEQRAALRKLSEEKLAPVLLLTAFSQPEIVEKAK